MKNSGKKLGLLLLLVGMAFSVQAQQAMFLQQGRIEYEKRVNIQARMKELWDGEEDSWSASIRKDMPQYKVTYFNYSFAGNTSLYQPGRDNSSENKTAIWGDSPAEENVVYSRLDSMQSVSQKKVFEQLFLVKDTIRVIRWKITDETRKIAGFDCRRANAIIMDSIYVVAFYTDAIVTPGGPESFSGLPGMILGVALPHEHVTWFATKVLVDDIKEGTLKAPVKGKQVDNKGINAALEKSIGKWGNWGKAHIKAIML